MLSAVSSPGCERHERSPRRDGAARLRVSDEVAEALRGRRAVVALESTLLAHGLPWPENLEVATAIEDTVRRAGATPATIAVLAGESHVGLDGAKLEQVARGHFLKVGVADLGPLVAAGGNGATTVSATAYAAAWAGICMFATGGIGGVHRGDSMDISSDLTTLASHPVAVVSAGAKAILDLARTLEYLETLGVPVIGYGTSELPGFYTRKSGLSLQHRVDSAEQAAAVLKAHFALHPQRGLLLCNPIPEDEALDEATIERALEAALSKAAQSKVSGKELTPFLLAAIARETGNRSVKANRALVLSNAAVAADIAVALAGSA
jgi:pseudouridine-5'-phosphate glycosidase